MDCKRPTKCNIILCGILWNLLFCPLAGQYCTLQTVSIVLFPPPNRIRNTENRQGKDFLGGQKVFGWYFLEILPLQKSKDKPRKTKEKPRKNKRRTNKTYLFIMFCSFLCFCPCQTLDKTLANKSGQQPCQISGQQICLTLGSNRKKNK